MSTTGRLRVGRRSRYLLVSFFFHIAVLAVAALFFAAPPEEPVAIEVSLILETGDSDAGQGSAQQSHEQSQRQAAQQQASQQAEPAPRPSAKPAAAPRKAAPRPSPPQATASAQQVVPASTQNLPVAEQAPAAPTASAWKNPDEGQGAGGTATGTSSGGGQHAAASSGAGAGSAAGRGKKGRSANEYLERVRQALAKHKKYPDQARKAKQEGTVSISLHLARDGTVLGAEIANGSGFPLLDQAAVQMARDASPVPRVPDDIDGDSVRIALPVTYSIGFFGRF